MSTIHDLPAATPVDVDGATIATWVLGPTEPAEASAPDVVLCHGTPWSARVWAQVAHDLARDHRVHLWDMPGYGASDKDPMLPLDLPTQSKRLAALLRHWGLERPHVVAHDIGGAVALGAHLLLDAEVADLFLWDVVTLAPWGSDFFRLVAGHGDVFARLPPALHGALVREYIGGAVRHGLPAEVVDELARPWLDAEGQTSFYRQIASLRTRDTVPIAASLGSARCPVRIGWGAEDPWIPREQAYRLRDALPGDPAVAELTGVAHLAPVEDADGVVAALRAWLSRPGG